MSGLTERCDYRKPNCTNGGIELEGVWYCLNHLPTPTPSHEGVPACICWPCNDLEGVSVNDSCPIHGRKAEGAHADVVEAYRLMLEEAGEALELALGRLGCSVEGNDGGGAGRHDADSFGGINTLRRIKLLLSPPAKPKTAEERVTIERWIHDKSKYIVLVEDWNGNDSATFPYDEEGKRKAEIYRRGLIDYLKEKQATR